MADKIYISSDTKKHNNHVYNRAVLRLDQILTATLCPAVTL